MLRRAAVTTCYLLTAAGICVTLGAAVDAVPRSGPSPNPFRGAVAQKTSGVKPAVPAGSTQDHLNDLSLQVEALLVLYYLDTTPAQLKAMAEIARETAARPRDRKPARASVIFRRTLTDIRAALLKNDTERITELADTLDELRETEKSEFDDDFATTDAARKKAPGIARQMSVSQMLAYVANYEDDLSDPMERITEAMTEGRTLSLQDWKEMRDEVAKDVSRMVGGVDQEKTLKVREEITALLDKTRLLKADELRAQREELEKTARQIIGNLGPTEILRNSMEMTMAEVLSNPQLPEVLDMRVKGLKK